MLEGDAAKQDWEEQYTTLQQCLIDPDNEALPEKPAITLAQLHTTLRDDTLRALAMPLTDIKATALKVFIIKVNSFLDSHAGYSESEIELQGLREKSHIQYSHCSRIQGPTIRLLTEFDGCHPVRYLAADDCLEYSAALSYTLRMSLRSLPDSLRNEAWQEAEEASMLLTDTTHTQLRDYQNDALATDELPAERDSTRDILIPNEEYTEMMRSYRQAVEGQNQDFSHGAVSEVGVKG